MERSSNKEEYQEQTNDHKYFLRNDQTKKLSGYSKVKSQKHKHLEMEKNKHLMLQSSRTKKFTRFTIYMDDQVGIASRFQDQLMCSEMDEDYDSSQEIINNGCFKGESQLKKHMLKNKLLRKSYETDSGSFRGERENQQEIKPLNYGEQENTNICMNCFQQTKKKE